MPCPIVSFQFASILCCVVPCSCVYLIYRCPHTQRPPVKWLERSVQSSVIRSQRGCVLSVISRITVVSGARLPSASTSSVFVWTKSAHTPWAHFHVKTCNSIKEPLCDLTPLTTDRRMECTDTWVWVWECVNDWKLNKSEELMRSIVIGNI